MANTTAELHQADLPREHCRVTLAVFNDLGLPTGLDFGAPGQTPQLLLRHGASDAALFTLVGITGGSGPQARAVEIRAAALERLSPALIWSSLHVQVNHPPTGSGYTEDSVSGNGWFVVVLAPHGDDIETGTDEQAELATKHAGLAAFAPRLYIARGSGSKQFDRWHITSDDLSELSFPVLAQTLNTPTTYAVAFHGFSDDTGLSHVLVGGRVAKKVREQVADEIKAANIMVTRPGSTSQAEPLTATFENLPAHLDGNARQNIVNRAARAGGLQIESQTFVRKDLAARDVIANAVATVLAGLPDAYIRDSIADTGGSHGDPLYMSPDIIVRQALEQDPQTTFGNRNDANLSQPVLAGRDHYVYVRVFNRGGGPVDVTARVYWSDVATLVQPSTWNVLGPVTIPAVPPGNTPAVSTTGVKWPREKVTGKHYCFVCVLESDYELAPDQATVADLPSFERFVRWHDNVAWRNVIVVDAKNGSFPIQLPFMVRRFPDDPSEIRLEIEEKLHGGVRAELRLPLHTALRPDPSEHGHSILSRRRLAAVEVPASPTPELPLALTLARRPSLRRDGGHVTVRQTAPSGFPVGAVTFTLAPRRQRDRWLWTAGALLVALLGARAAKAHRHHRVSHRWR